MKKADEIVSKPTVTLAIQGMWVTDSDSKSIGTLPFDHCSDEHDSLAIFQYRDPRMLLELTDRRMVEDISEYLSRYTGSRLEPPSFIVTPEELKSYIHLPAGEGVESLHSLNWMTPKKVFSKGSLGGEEPEYSGGPPTVPAEVVRMVKVPKFAKTLEDSVTQPFDHLASATVRTFEWSTAKEAPRSCSQQRRLTKWGGTPTCSIRSMGSRSCRRLKNALLSLQNCRQSLVSWSEEVSPGFSRSGLIKGFPRAPKLYSSPVDITWSM